MTHFGSEFEKDWSTCSLCGTRRPRAELTEFRDVVVGVPQRTGLECRDEPWCAKRVAERKAKMNGGEHE